VKTHKALAAGRENVVKMGRKEGLLVNIMKLLLI
jgi:hypothetical protein